MDSLHVASQQTTTGSKTSSRSTSPCRPRGGDRERDREQHHQQPQQQQQLLQGNTQPSSGAHHGAHHTKTLSHGSVESAKVVKVECMNHCIKNYGKQLHKIKSDTKNIPLAIRKLLTTDKIKALQKCAQNAIYVNAHGDVQKLKADIRNSVNHVYGHHTDCNEAVCDKVGDVTDDQTPFLTETGAHNHVYGALNQLLTKSHLLIDRETSNLAELYMSLLARFNMGKRLNLVGRDSFQTRCCLSGLKFNESHSWHSKSWKEVFPESPGKHLQSFIASRENLKLKRKARDENCKLQPKRLKLAKETAKEKDYGPNISEVILDDHEVKEEVSQLIGRLQVTSARRDAIAKDTIGQFDNLTFLNARRHRLTASNFGNVVKRTQISCHNLVKSILSQKSFTSAATTYGKINEIVAKRKFENLRGVIIQDCGIYIDVENGFLAASPDGIINDDELVEVKCLYSVAKSKEDVTAAIKQGKVKFLKFEGETLEIVKNHNYYHQIQGQLNICQKQKCHLVVYCGEHNPILSLEIKREEIFWNNVMLPKLKTFYEDCLGPEIILNRLGKGLSCRNPPYLEVAIAKKAKKQSK